jgi:hypothetical protein
MAETSPTRISVEAQVEDLAAPSLTSQPGCRSLVIILGVCVLVIGLALSLVAGWVLQQHSHSRKHQPSRHAAVGHRDGQFSFQVKQQDCGLHQLGPPGDIQVASGQFCMYLVHVVNVGDQPRILLSTNQRAIDASGKKYDVNGLASEVASPGGRPFPNLLWRNEETTVALVYDLPVEVTPVALELHDSPLSGGVELKL